MSKYTITVPLGKGTTWENNELRYMLRSLDRYLQFDFDVIVYCSEKVDWLNCKQVVVPRTYPKESLDFFDGQRHYENYYDVIHKLQAIIEDDDVSEDFFFVYDDILLLHDMYIHDMKRVVAGNHYDYNQAYFNNPKNKWTQTIYAALQICKANGYPLYSYETHLPRYYTKSNIKKMFSKHKQGINHIPYALASVYYNMFYKEPDICYFHKNTIKAGFYGGIIGNDGFNSVKTKQIEDAVKDKTWINYSNKGLTGHLKLWIERRYPQKSRFEK